MRLGMGKPGPRSRPRVRQLFCDVSSKQCFPCTKCLPSPHPVSSPVQRNEHDYLTSAVMKMSWAAPAAKLQGSPATATQHTALHYLQHLHWISTSSTLDIYKIYTLVETVDKLGCKGRYISDFLIGFPAICKLCCVVSCPYYCCYLLLSAPAQECVQSNYVANSHPALYQQHHSIRENISSQGSARAGRC